MADLSCVVAERDTLAQRLQGAQEMVDRLTHTQTQGAVPSLTEMQLHDGEREHEVCVCVCVCESLYERYIDIECGDERVQCVCVRVCVLNC